MGETQLRSLLGLANTDTVYWSSGAARWRRDWPSWPEESDDEMSSGDASDSSWAPDNSDDGSDSSSSDSESGSDSGDESDGM